MHNYIIPQVTVKNNGILFIHQQSQKLFILIAK